MKASLVKNIMRMIPISGVFRRQLLEYVIKFVQYPDPPITIKLNNNLIIFEIRNFKEYIQKQIYFFGYYEIRETRLLERILKPGDTFIDIGANIGWFTIHAAKLVGDLGKVYSFEPSSYIHEHLAKHVKINSLENVKLEKTALSNENGSAKLAGISINNEGTGSIISDCDINSVDSKQFEMVNTIKFDDYQSFPDKIELVKIDVEGAELKVIEGMKESLRSGKIDRLIVEIFDENLKKSGSSSQEILAFFKDLNYSSYLIGMFNIKPLDVGLEPLNVNVLFVKNKD